MIRVGSFFWKRPLYGNASVYEAELINAVFFGLVTAAAFTARAAAATLTTAAHSTFFSPPDKIDDIKHKNGRNHNYNNNVHKIFR